MSDQQSAKPQLTGEQMQQLDQQHIWHPYSSMVAPPPVYPVVSASGVHLKLADGRELLDGLSSWWSVIHGYNHPVINQAAKDQIDAMSHVMFGGITHPSAVKLAKLLVDITPAKLEKVFFSDSGSVAVEVAIKMAVQYWQSQGKAEKHQLLALKSGYHGDTFAAMSVCDPETGMHHLFSKVLKQQLFAESPNCGFHDSCAESDLRDIKQLLEDNHQQLAAVILEPIVQGASGMKFYSPELSFVRCAHSATTNDVTA
jgi:Adenosylmethionine-8-amino-7-oxononanoate aminotransferase